VAHGERALDLGCGCGATTLELARRVGPGGSVLGVDLSEPMLARARERAAGLGQVEFRAADAQTADLGAASFDLAYSRFGVMFFADPPAAFANVRRALRPAGRLGFVCWQEMRKNPYMFEPVAAAARHVTLPPPPAPDAPGPFAFADAARVRAILERAGFGRIEIAPWAGEIGLGEPEQALEFFFEIGPLAAALREAGAGPEVHTRVREAIREVLDRYSTPAGIRMPVHTWVVTARAGE
jgi:ubiquinone/menaquinone biosynthesis C-methylase UbiE